MSKCNRAVRQGPNTIIECEIAKLVWRKPSKKDYQESKIGHTLWKSEEHTGKIKEGPPAMWSKLNLHFRVYCFPYMPLTRLASRCSGIKLQFIHLLHVSINRMTQKSCQPPQRYDYKLYLVLQSSKSLEGNRRPRFQSSLSLLRYWEGIRRLTKESTQERHLKPQEWLYCNAAKMPLIEASILSEHFQAVLHSEWPASSAKLRIYHQNCPIHLYLDTNTPIC